MASVKAAEGADAGPVPTRRDVTFLPSSPVAPGVLVTLTRQSFAAASDQFNAMARFGFEKIGSVFTGNSDNDPATISKARLDRFLEGGVFTIDQHGDLHDYFDYTRAVEAIQAKAVALGYGPQSKAVPIDTVPGGYVGRYIGHDIYAPAQ